MKISNCRLLGSAEGIYSSECLPLMTVVDISAAFMHYTFNVIPHLFIIPHMCFIILLYCRPVSVAAFICLFAVFHCLHIQLQFFVTARHNKRMYARYNRRIIGHTGDKMYKSIFRTTRVAQVLTAVQCDFR